MNRAAVFALVAAGAVVGSVAGAAAVNRKKGSRRIKQQPYAAIGSGLLATGVAAVAYSKPACPPCADGTVPQATTIGLGGYSAAVAASAIIGGIAGAMAVGKNAGSRLAQQVYAPIGAGLLGAGAAAVFFPDPTSCAPCPPLAPMPPNEGNTPNIPPLQPAPTPVPTGPGSNNTTPANQSPPPR